MFSHTQWSVDSANGHHKAGAGQPPAEKQSGPAEQLAVEPGRKSWHPDACAVEILSGIAHMDPASAQGMPAAGIQTDTASMAWAGRA